MKKKPGSTRKLRSKTGELPKILFNFKGSAYFNYRGERYYLGKVSLLDAERERLRIVSEFEANGGIVSDRKESVTVFAFMKWAKKRYVCSASGYLRQSFG